MSSVVKGVKKVGRHGLTFTEGLVNPNTSFKKKLRTKSSQFIEPRKGTTAKARDASKLAARQQQLEKVRLAEAESEVATRRAGLGQKSGRRSLIKSSATGLATNLGGTA